MKGLFRRGGYLLLLVLVLASPAVRAQDVPLPLARSPEMNLQYHRARTAWRSGASVLEAKARIDRVLVELPDDVDARKLRAQVLMAMDRPAEALADARRAVELHPEDPEAQLILCEAARLNGNEALALRSLDLAAERVLDDAGFHLRLSWNAALLGRLDRAEAFARIALALNGSDAAAYYQLARVFVLKNQLGDASAILEQGLQRAVLDPDAIRQDSLLVRLVDRPGLQSRLRR